MRTATQKFGAMDQSRMRYGLTEKDEATGLDHTWFRKHENNSGRWTTPDPMSGSVSDPQSFNRYAYTQNDPINLIDPSGLEPKVNPCGWVEGDDGVQRWVCFGPENTIHTNTNDSRLTEYLWVLNSRFSGFSGGRGGGGGPQNKAKSSCATVVDDLVNRLMDIAGSITLGLGRDMGYEAAYGKYVKGNQDPRPLPVDGFQNQLTNNGQGADVYKHIYGIAGAVLIGDNYVVARGLPGRAGLTGWQTVFVQVQDDRLAAAGGRLESETELRDDFAGMEVGKAMLNANKDRTRPEHLQRTLFNILCSN